MELGSDKWKYRLFRYYYQMVITIKLDANILTKKVYMYYHVVPIFVPAFSWFYGATFSAESLYF